MMDKKEVVVVNNGTNEAIRALNIAFDACCALFEKYHHLDVFQEAVNGDVFETWEELERVFFLVRSAKLELDMARGEKTQLVKMYLDDMAEKIAYFNAGV